MNDQGEKIVFLAREILNAGMTEAKMPVEKTHITMSFKTLCLTTFLAAAGGAVVAELTYVNDRPLNRYEKTEIDALVFYAARVKGINEEMLRHDVAEKVGAVDYEDLSASNFDSARRYLQEKAQ